MTARHILILGASGFIGSEIARSLLDDGHRVTALGRDIDYGQRILPEAEWRQGDLRRMASPADWLSWLDGVDVVINASGALQSGLRDDVTTVQQAAIIALGEAAARQGVQQLIQISAASADQQAGSEFMDSKAKADAALLPLAIPVTVLRPGLVIGRNAFGGNELIRFAAAMPGPMMTPSGMGQIQCVALGDVVAAARCALADPAGSAGQYDLVEEQGHSLAEVIAAHRRWLGLPEKRRSFELPPATLRPVTLIADMLGWFGWRSPLRSNAIAALAFGVKGDASEGAALLGRPLLSLHGALDATGQAGKADRWHARAGTVYPFALFSLLALWLISGILGLIRSEEAAALLIAGGMDAGTAKGLVLGGSLADLAIAGGLLWRPWLKPALAASLLLTLGYVSGSLVWRPDLWLDPLGAMLKTWPILALTSLCLALAEER